MAGLTVSTRSNRSEDVWGRHNIRTLKVTFDSAYPAGGEAFDVATYGVADPANAIVLCKQRPATTAAEIYDINYDPTAKTLLVTVKATGVEAGAIDLSALVVDVVIIEV
jgi:hypothetical protein